MATTADKKCFVYEISSTDISTDPAVDVPVPQVVEEIVEMTRVIPQERVRRRDGVPRLRESFGFPSVLHVMKNLICVLVCIGWRVQGFIQSLVTSR